jgi:putative ABC transport system ATP-binding protein
LLDVDSLSKSYRVGQADVHALRGVSFTLPAGASMSITGYSGSGKSTLLGIVGGLDRPTTGDEQLAGQSYRKMSEAELATLRRTKIGFVFQTFNLLPALTAYENVYLSARLAGMAHGDARTRSNGLLQAVGVAGRAEHRPSQLSGGEQQRVAIARALVTQPLLLLADEPTGDLDSENGAVVAELLLELSRNRESSCIIVTHNNELAARTDSTIALRDGAIVSEGH